MKFHSFYRFHTYRSTPGMIYSIVNYDFFYGNCLPFKTVVLSKLKVMEIKVRVLGTHIDNTSINNVLSGRNDHLEPLGKN